MESNKFVNIVFVNERNIEAISDVKQQHLNKSKLVTGKRSGGKGESPVLGKKDTTDKQSVGKRTRKRPFCRQCAGSGIERSWVKQVNSTSEKVKRSNSWINRKTAIKLLTVKEKAGGVKFPTTRPKKQRLSDKNFSESNNTKQEDDIFQKIRPKWHGMLLQKSSRVLVNSDSSETDDHSRQTGPRSPTLWGYFGNSHLQASTPKELRESSFSPKLLTKKQEAVCLQRRVSDRTARRKTARESLQFPLRKKDMFFQDVPPSCPNQGTSDLTPFEELASVVKEATAVKEGEVNCDIDLSAVESYFSDD